MNRTSPKISNLISLIGLSATFALLAGCGRAEFTFAADAATFGQLDAAPPVCAPFDPSNPGSDQTGLAGSIKYLEDSQPRSATVNDLLANGRDAGVRLLLNQLATPTISFLQGFMNPATGAPLTRPTGDVLNEWFAIDMYSELSLSENQADGFYQLALLSDDGSVLNINATKTAAGTVLINSPTDQQTKMSCSTKAVYLKKHETLPIRLKYFQGPRAHIALTMIWRKVAAENSAKDALCGMGGNAYFWDSSVTPSAPTAKFNELLARGWSIPAAKNFILPPDVRSNPCAVH